MVSRAVEAVAVGAAGGLLGALTGRLVGELVDLESELALVGAVVGGLNGVCSGWRRVYGWREVRGPIAFVLDSTWSLVMTTTGVIANLYAWVVPGSGYVPELSERQNLHVHRKGLVVRRGYAVTFGHVVDGAGDVELPRRRRLVTDHEDVHAWQARWWGPLFPVLLGAWFVGGSATGVLVWLARGRREPLRAVVETTGYYMNPYEYWAYSRHGIWRPSGMVDGIGWRRPWVASRESLRRRTGRTAA